MSRSARATLATAVLLVTGGVMAVPAAAAGQVGCLPPGAPLTPVPWAQLLLAPEQAWAMSTGAGQRVAVVSTGIAEHPQLTDVVLARVDLAPDPEFGEPSGERDCLGVGTGVAGVIAASSTEGVGFHGLAPDARLLDAKIVGDQYPTDREPGSASPTRVARGIEWAVDQDATVIVVPTITYEDRDVLREAVARALAADIVVVASVGEPDQAGTGEPADASEPGPDSPPGPVPYPAGYDGVIGVAAIDPAGTAVSRTSHVDLVAPGVDILTTYPEEGLGFHSGTGFAAGYVAASVALVRAYRPDLSAPEVVRQLLATAAPAAEGIGSARYGAGIVNPHQAMVAELVADDPVALPPYAPGQASAEELARQQAQDRSDRLASRLAFGGLAVAAAVAAAVWFGTRGRRRRWRAGLAAPLLEQPEAEHPEPPRDLLSDVPRG